MCGFIQNTIFSSLETKLKKIEMKGKRSERSWLFKLPRWLFLRLKLDVISLPDVPVDRGVIARKSSKNPPSADSPDKLHHLRREILFSVSLSTRPFQHISFGLLTRPQQSAQTLTIAVDQCCNVSAMLCHAFLSTRGLRQIFSSAMTFVITIIEILRSSSCLWGDRSDTYRNVVRFVMFRKNVVLWCLWANSGGWSWFWLRISRRPKEKSCAITQSGRENRSFDG